MSDQKDLVIASLRKSLAKFTDPEFYVKEKPVGKKPGVIFNIVELQNFAAQGLQEAAEIAK